MVWKDFVNLIHKQTNYRQICLFYISWLNYTLSKMLFVVISKPYMVGIIGLCHLVRFFCDNKYQKFFTWVFFLIHISTCFWNILGKEFMSKKGIWKDVKGFLVMWLWKHWTCTHALLRASAIFDFVQERRTMFERKTF